MAKPAELLPGTLDMLILKAVSLKPLHGYGVLLRIKQISKQRARHPAGLALSGAVPPRAPGPHQRQVGREREQPQGQVLLLDGRGPATAGRRKPRAGTGWPTRSARRSTRRSPTRRSRHASASHSLRSALAVRSRRRRFEDGVSDELRFHIDAYADDLIRSGVPPAEARRRARLELGGTEALKEELRAARGQRLLDELRQDTRYAVRRLRRSRGPAVVACSRSASASTSRSSASSTPRCCGRCRIPSPIGSSRSRRATSRAAASTRPRRSTSSTSSARASSFARIAAYYPPGFTLTGGGQAERVSGARASSGIFDVFGVQPALGRGFLPEEDRAGAPPVAVISHALWVRRYRGDRAAVGQAIVLSGRPYTLVGVLPEGFHSPAMWPRTPEVWVPLGLDPNVGRRNARMLRVLGRLRPGVTVDQARAELDAIATRARHRVSRHEHGHRRDGRRTCSSS